MRPRSASAVGSAWFTQFGQHVSPSMQIFLAGTNVPAVPPCDDNRDPNPNEYEKRTERYRTPATHAHVPDTKADKRKPCANAPNRAEEVGQFGVRAFPFSRIVFLVAFLLDLPLFIDKSQ